MSATFASFNSALSALRYNQVLMDTASGNIANVSTEGYARRRAVGEAMGAPAVPAMWSRYDGLRRRRPGRAASTGWSTPSWTPARDASTATRPTSTPGRRPSSGSRPGSASPATTVSPPPSRTSAGLARPRQQPGLRRRPQPGAVRGQAPGRRDQRSSRRNIAGEESDQRFRLQTDVSEVNTLAADLAATNKQHRHRQPSTAPTPAPCSTSGTSWRCGSPSSPAPWPPSVPTAASTCASAVSRWSPAGDAGTFEIATGVAADGSADGSPVSFSITTPAGVTTAVPDGLRGEVGATKDLLNVTLPAYRAGLGSIAKTLADEMNTQHAAGFDASGTAGGALLHLRPGGPRRLADRRDHRPGRCRRLQRRRRRGPGRERHRHGGRHLASRTTTSGWSTASAPRSPRSRRLAANQQTLTAPGRRLPRAALRHQPRRGDGVHAPGAARLRGRRPGDDAPLDSVLDTLINRTGLVR